MKLTARVPPTADLRELIVDVHNCARCGGHHFAHKFRRFVMGPSDPPITHWAPCPTNSDPILLIAKVKP